MKKNSFIEGTIVATLTIVLIKVLGIIYVIPFYAVIGALGSALYSYAYNVYATFLDISSAGIPIAIAKLVSEFDSLKMKDAKVRTFRIGIKIVSVLSIVCFLVLIFFTKPIVLLIIGNKIGGNSIQDIILVIRVIAFSILIIPFLSVSRGYLQGHKFISPTSSSQMLEQIVRIIVVLVGSYVAIKILGKSVSTGVAIACFGAFVGGFASIIYILKKIKQNRTKLDLKGDLEKDDISNKDILKKIIQYALPFIIINATVNLYNLVDMSLVIRTLGHFGFTGADSEFIAGVITTWGYKLNRIVNAISTGLIISLIPNIVAAHTLGKNRTVNNIFNQALQIVLFVSIPAAIGLSFLAAPVWNAFYGASDLGPVIFKVSILTSILSNLYFISIQTAQSLNEYKTVYRAVILGFLINALMDIPFMYICNYLNIHAYYGAIFATLFGYSVSVLIVFNKLLKREEFKIKESVNVFAKISFAVLVMVIVLRLINVFYQYHYLSRLNSVLYIAIYTIVGALVYLFITYKFGLIDKIFGRKTVSKIVRKITFGKVNLSYEEEAEE